MRHIFLQILVIVLIFKFGRSGKCHETQYWKQKKLSLNFAVLFRIVTAESVDKTHDIGEFSTKDRKTTTESVESDFDESNVSDKISFEDNIQTETEFMKSDSDNSDKSTNEDSWEDPKRRESIKIIVTDQVNTGEAVPKTTRLNKVGSNEHQTTNSIETNTPAMILLFLIVFIACICSRRQ